MTMTDSTSLRKRLFSYALPSVVGMLIVGVQTFVDGIFVAKGVGALGLAAVNLSMPLLSVMLSVAIMIVSGGIVLAGLAQGQGDEARVRSCTSLTFLVLLAASLLMAAAVAIGMKPLCYLLGCNDLVYPHMRRYLGITGVGFLFYCIPNFTEAFTRLRGRPNWVFLSGSICCAVNVVLDYFFVLRLGWGTAGAAAATCIANSSAALVLAPNLRFGRLRASWHWVGRMLYNGSSEMFTSVSAAVTMYLFNVMLMRLAGPSGVAALTIVCYLNFMVNMSIFGLSQALYPLMSFQLGEGSYGGIRSLLQYALLFGGCIGWGVFLMVLLFKRSIVGLFAGDDVELTTLAMSAASVVTLHYLVSFVNIIGCSFHTAVQRPLESVVIAVCRSILFVLLPLLVLTPRVGTLGVWLSMPIAEGLTLLVTVPLSMATLQRLKRTLARGNRAVNVIN